MVFALAASVVIHVLLLVTLALMLRSVATSGGGSIVSLDLGPSQTAAAQFAAESEQPEFADDSVQDRAPDRGTNDPSDARAKLTRAVDRVAMADVGLPDRVSVGRGELTGDPVLLDRTIGGGLDALVGPVDLDAASSLDGASFAGVSAKRARSVVYSVDASGAMVTSLPFVLDELRRSIAALGSDQSFAVILFGRRVGDNADASGVRAFPSSGLVAASPSRKAEFLAWLEAAEARGASNPLDGLLAALDRQPEVVFLLSRSIRRTDGREAAGDWGPGREAILAELDRANPIRKSIFGPPARSAQVKCVQFLEEDPTGVMRAIAKEHGGGGDSYRLLLESELRLR